MARQSHRGTSSLYQSHADYYDLIYSWKDYRAEARKVHEWAERFRLSDGSRLLDVACGTGRHLEYLRRWYDCAGIDQIPEMLAVARRRLGRFRLWRGDMRTFRRPERFDIITCLFSAIAYVRTYSSLRQAVQNMTRHLVPGGVLLVEPFFTPRLWRPRSVHLATYESSNVKIARLSFSAQSRGVSAAIDDHFLLGIEGRGVEYFASRHETGLFEVVPTLRIFRAAGLRSRFLRHGLLPGRGMYVGVRPM